jgi:hypothetical protein
MPGGKGRPLSEAEFVNSYDSPVDRSTNGMTLAPRKGRVAGSNSVEVTGFTSSSVKNYEFIMQSYLANSGSVKSYQTRLARLMEDMQPRENLYAIVMPGGHGKTWLAEEYGFIDVDELVDVSSSLALFEERIRCVRTNTKEWDKHNEIWYKSLNDSLSLMTFERPTLILVHSEECAFTLGAQLLGVIVLDEAPFERNIKHRTEEGLVFSRISRTFVQYRSMNQVIYAHSNQDMEHLVLALCNRGGVPTACPYKHSKELKSKHYARGVPSWLLEGKVVGMAGETDRVLALEAEGKIPKECVDHFVKYNCPSGKAFGFGTTMNDWARLVSKAVGAINDPKNFDLDEDLFETFPPDSQAEKHRVNVTLRRLKDYVDLSEPDINEILASHVGEKHLFVTGLICHWLGLGSQMRPILSQALYPFYLVRLSKFDEVLGQLHANIRISNYYCTTRVTEEERQSIMYMQMLVGRKMYEADWVKVVEERKLGTSQDFVSYDPVRRLWTRAQYLTDFDSALTVAYSGMYNDPKPINVENFVDFWKLRRQWVAKGSTVLNQLPKHLLTYTIEFMDGLVSTIENRHNKKSLFENHEVLELIDETVETWNATKAVPKLNETGKERELLPGTLMHYLVFSYVLYMAEKQAPIGTTRLNVNDDDNITYYDRKMTGLYHMLYDWANFNAQHSTKDMAKVISALSDFPTAPRDYAFFCQAIAESFDHMWLLDPNGERHKLEKGLFSGWRGTTWINTVLNFVYVNIGVKCCCRLYHDFDPIYFDHGGDDLDVAFKSAVDCFRMMEVMDKIGYEAKAIKQMVDKKAEFYRNTITQSGVFASPTRALANFVSGNWESAGAKTLSEKTVSILDQVWKLIRRGVEPDFCETLATISLNHWLKIKLEDEWFVLRPEIVHGDMADGGLGIPDEEGMIWKLDHPLKEKYERGLDAVLPGTYCSGDFVDVMEEDLVKHGIKIVDKKRLVTKLAEQSYDLEKFEERAALSELNKCNITVLEKKEVIQPLCDVPMFEEFLNWMSGNPKGLELTRLEMLREFLGHMTVNGLLLDQSDLIALCLNEYVSTAAVEFRGDMYYRRLVPDFLANHIDKFVRIYGNRANLDMADMQNIFRTLCYMAAGIFRHHC